MLQLLRKRNFLQMTSMTLIIVIISSLICIPIPGFKINKVEADEPIVSVTKTIQPDSIAGKDAQIYGYTAATNINYGLYDTIQLGQMIANTYSPNRGLLEFSLSSIPTNAVITKAELQMNCYFSSSTITHTVGVYRINRAWTEGTGNGTATNNGATWNKYDGVNSWSVVGGDYNPTPESTADVTIPFDYKWDITNLAKSWFDGSVANNGILIKSSLESGQSIATYKYFGTSDNAIVSRRPQLLVTYSIPDSTPPSASIALPKVDQRVTGITSIQVSANDAVELSKVEVYIDDRLIYTQNRPSVVNWAETAFETTWDTTAVDASGNRIYSEGIHNVNIKAYDTAGNIGTSSVNAVVDNTSPIVTKIIRPNATDGKDTMINGSSTLSNTNYGKTTYMTLGQTSGTSTSPSRGLLEFDLSSIPSNAAITKAELQMYYWFGQNTIQTNISVHRVNRSWTEGTGDGTATNDGATWNKYNGINSWTATGGDYNATPESTVSIWGPTAGNYKWDISNLVKGWFNGVVPNYGVLLKNSIESGQTVATTKSFYTSDNASAYDYQLPQLLVSYSIPDTTSPTASLAVPKMDQRVTGITDIQVSANDAVELAKVEVFIDDNLIYTENRPYGIVNWTDTSFSTTWNTDEVDEFCNNIYNDGLHSVNIKAYDTAGNVGTTNVYTIVDNTSPQVTKIIQPDATMGKDTPIFGSSTSANLNYGTGIGFQIGQITGGTYSPSRGLMQFDLSSIPSNAAITKAELQMYYKFGLNSYANIGVHRVNRNWLEGNGNGSSTNDGATWNKYDGLNNWSTVGGDYNSTPESTLSVGGTTSGYCKWDVSNLVKGWFNGITPNNGLLLKSSLETGQSVATYKYFPTSDDTSISQRPQLLVTYSIPDSTPPTASITSPNENQVLSGTNTLSVGASDAIELSKVEVYIDDNLIHTENKPWGVVNWADTTFQVTWDTAQLDASGNRIFCDGSHIINILAYDTAGNIGNKSRYVGVDNGSPKVTKIIQPDGAAGKDSMVYRINPDLNYGNSSTIEVGQKTEVQSSTTSGLLEFDLSSIPDNAAITKAELKMYRYDSVNTNEMNVSVYNLINNCWTEGTGNATSTQDGVTWNTYNGSGEWNLLYDQISSQPESTVSISNQGGFYIWDITKLAQGWQNNTIVNKGILLKGDKDMGQLTPTSKAFYSSDHSNPSLRPQLVITYTAVPITGLAGSENMRSLDPTVQNLLNPLEDGIDPSMGTHSMERSLLNVNGAQPLNFDLKYNSALLKEGPMGKGWGHNFETWLETLPNGNIKVNWTANRVSNYEYKGTGVYSPLDLANRYDTMLKEASGDFVLKKYDQSIYRFNSSGKLIDHINKNGQSHILTYNTEGVLSEVNEPISGRHLNIHYNDANLVDSVTDNMGRRVTFEYDSGHNLIKIVDAKGQVTNYTYNLKGQVLTETDNDNKQKFSITYDDKGRVLTKDDGVVENLVNHFYYDETSQPGTVVTTVYDRNGSKKTSTYNDNYQLLSVKDELGNIAHTYKYDTNGNIISDTDATGHITTFTFDERGNMLTTTDPAGRMTIRTYDERNNLLSVEDAVYNTVYYTYDQNNNVLTFTDQMGYTTSNTYDNNSLLLEKTNPKTGKTTYTYSNGRPYVVTDPAGNTTTYGYDAVGRLISSTDSAGKTTAMSYDEVDNLLNVIDPLGYTKSYTYDCNDNKLSEKDAKGNFKYYYYDGNNNLAKVVDSVYSSVYYDYDGEDRLVKTIDARGNYTVNTYDAKGQLIKTTDELGYINTFEYDVEGNLVNKYDALGNRIAAITYDVLNNPVSETDALNRTTYKHYDVLNRLDCITDPMGRVNRFTYDGLSRIISSTDALDGTSTQSFDANGNKATLIDQNKNQTRFDYDNNDRLIEETSATGDSTLYQYNSRNLVSQKTNGRQQITTYQYDDMGRLESSTDPVGTVRYSYDANGNTTSVSDSVGNILREYDALNRLIKYTDVYGNVIEYEYDTVSNLVYLTYPGGKKVHYGYDAANRLTSVTDWAGRVTSYEYDANDRLVKTIRPNGTVLTVSCDTDGQVIQQKDVDGNNNIINQYDFTYDLVGSVLTEQDTNDASSFALYNSYDANNELKQQRRLDSNSNLLDQSDFTYDAGWNMTTMQQVYGDSNEVSYTYGNRINLFNGQTVTYDADGNMTTGPLGGAMVNYNYDARNRLISVGDTSYIYDADNNRISIIEDVYGGTNRTNFVVNPNADLSQVLIKTDSQGNQTFYVYGLGLIGEETQGTYRTYHYDLRGSTVALTDENGNDTDRFEYGPYGELTNHSGTTQTPFLYNGRDGVMTDANGLYYMRARYYNPDIKRFISEDEFEGFPTSPQTQHKYLYCENNPINKVDPNGDYALAAGLYFIPGVGQALAAATLVVAAVAATAYVGYKIVHFAAEHKKNARKSTWDKHTKPRPGRESEKKKQDKKWKRNR